MDGIESQNTEPGHPLIGRRLPGTPWLIEGRIGAGTMGVVLRAHHQLLGRAAAIKVMHRGIARQGRNMDRMRQEATTAAQLGNPHIPARRRRSESTPSQRCRG